jgi:hypothetical protein
MATIYFRRILCSDVETLLEATSTARDIYLYLVAGPMAERTGLVVVRKAMIAAELGITKAQVCQSLEQMQSLEVIRWTDLGAKVVVAILGIPRELWPKANAQKGWIDDAARVPDCDALAAWFDALGFNPGEVVLKGATSPNRAKGNKTAHEGSSEGSQDPSLEGSHEGSNDRELERELKQEPIPASEGAGKGKDNDLCNDIINAYKRTLPDLKQSRPKTVMTGLRRQCKKLKGILDDDHNRSDFGCWQWLFEGIAKDDWYGGRDDWHGANLVWLLERGNLTKAVRRIEANGGHKASGTDYRRGDATDYDNHPDFAGKDW